MNINKKKKGKKMKTLKKVIAENPEYKRLINAIIRRIGIESVPDVINHGIAGGYDGFRYFDENANFFKRHKKDIIRLLKEVADSFGTDFISMIADFSYLKGDFSITEIAEAIFTGKGENSDVILNEIVWFTAEEVCNWFEDD